MSVMILSIFSGTRDFTAKLEFNLTESNSIFGPFIENTPGLFKEGFLTILPLLIIFLFFQKVYFKMSSRNVAKMVKGFIYAFIGLFLFLVGVNTGFMDVGGIIGHTLASFDNKTYVVIIAFILGFVSYFNCSFNRSRNCSGIINDKNYCAWDTAMALSFAWVYYKSFYDVFYS